MPCDARTNATSSSWVSVATRSRTATTPAPLGPYRGWSRLASHARSRRSRARPRNGSASRSSRNGASTSSAATPSSPSRSPTWAHRSGGTRRTSSRLGVGERGLGIRREEPAHRGEEGDRRRLRGGQPVQLVRRQVLHAREEPGEAFRRLAADEVRPGSTSGGHVRRPSRSPGSRAAGTPGAARSRGGCVVTGARPSASASYRARSVGSLSQSCATLIRFARSSAASSPPATSGWWRLRSARQATSIASGTH